jgi:signal transduction histidine kinase
MLFAIVLLLTIGCIAFVLVREAQRVPRPDSLRGRIRARGWGLLLLPVAMAAAVMAGGAHGLIPAELGLAALAIGFAPKLAAKLVPYGVLGLAVFGVKLAKGYHYGSTSGVQYLFIHAGPGFWGTWPVLVEAGLLFLTGLWLLLRLDAPGAGLVRAPAARWLDSGRGGISGAQALLLIPVMGLTMQLLGPGNWFGFQAVDGLDAAVIDLTAATAGLVLVFRSRVWAATLAEAGLLALGLWLAPRVMRHHLAGPVGPDPELAARARQLTQRVQTLTKTRHDAVDTAAAELRRIERDLHDGAQARLVALGMSLRAAVLAYLGS